MTLVIELEANLEEEFKKNFKDLLGKNDVWCTLSIRELLWFITSLQTYLANEKQT
jgi:hypothetical protein